DPADGHVLDASGGQLLVQVAHAGKERAEPALAGLDVAGLDVEVGVQLMTRIARAKAVAMPCAVFRRKEIVVVKGPETFAVFAGCHADPGHAGALGPEAPGQAVDDGNDVRGRRQAVDVEALHVDDDQRRAAGFEAVVYAQPPALLHDALDDVAGHDLLGGHGNRYIRKVDRSGDAALCEGGLLFNSLGWKYRPD